MKPKRTIEIFSAGCPACQDAIKLISEIACPSCEVSILEMSDSAVAERARRLGIRTVPAVVIDGVIATCCAGSGPDEGVLRAAGLGQTAV